MQRQLLSHRFPVVFAVVLLSALCARADLVIYSDSVTNDFEDRGWAPRSFTNTAPVHSGKYSISTSPTVMWEGLSFYHVDYSLSFTH